MLYNEPFNFKPIPTITPMNNFWQNSTWKFGIPKITCGGSSEPTWKDVVISGLGSVTLVNAKANGLNYVKLFGGCEQNGTPTPSNPVDIVCNNGAIKVKDNELPLGYKRLLGISFDTDIYYETNKKLYGSDTLTLTVSNTSTLGRNLIGAYSGTGDAVRNFSLFIYGSSSTQNSYLRHGTILSRPRLGSGKRTLVVTPTGTDGFLNDVTYQEEDFETTSTFWIGGLPNSSSSKYDGNIEGNITVSTRLKYIPVERETDGAIGYYETFNNEFLEKQGTGTPVSMGYDTSHLTEIYYDGTVETVEVDTTGDTATAEPLLAVGNYKDVQNVTTGEVTRNIGIYLLDGTEDWQAVGTSYADGSKRYYFNDNDYSKFADTGELCTHFVQAPLANRDSANQIGHFFTNQNSFHIRISSSLASDVTALKSWLKGQIDAGTPVMFTYPLATPTTETVTPQPLSIQAGTNIVEITQASISGIEYVVDTTKMTYTNATMSSDYVMTTTNNSSSRAITTDTLPLNTANTWEWRTKFTYTSSGTYGTVIGHNNSDFKAAPYIQIVNGEAGIQTRGIGIVIPVDHIHYVTPADNYSKAIDVNTPYYLKFGFSGTEYYLELNTEGWDAPFTRYCTYQSTAKCYVVTNTKTEFMNRYTGSQVVGSMDFKETRLYINGDVYWEYVTVQGKELELEVSYKAGVEVTIEEIEAVNNDNQVEVTINE